VPGAIPRQPGRGETGPINLPEQPGQAAGSGWASRTDQGASQPGGDMPDWRLAPPAWSPPPPVTPGEPVAGPSASPDVAPAAEAVPAKTPEQKRRGLFRRKNKSEPTPVAETAESGWVDVPAAGESDQPTTADPAPSGPRGFSFGGLVTSRFGSDGDGRSDDPMADNRSDRDPTGSGPDLRPRDPDTFGRVDDLAARDSSAPDRGARDSGPRDSGARDSGARDLGAGLGTAGLGAANRSRNSWDAADDTEPPPADRSTRGRSSWDPAASNHQDQPAADANRSRASWDPDGAGRYDQPSPEPGTTSTGRGSWDPASGGTQQAPADAGTPDQDRGTGRKAGRAQRHLHSVDLGSDGDDGSWDIDDAPARGTTAKEDEADDDETASPTRGLFRRNRNSNPESTDPAADAAPDQPRSKRAKGDKPIRERDEEYVDWVTGLSAPEPVNERRRDETPRRSLRSTTRQKDE
jgi:hypothetical protein